jgi:hypothetical protein
MVAISSCVYRRFQRTCSYRRAPKALTAPSQSSLGMGARKLAIAATLRHLAPLVLKVTYLVSGAILLGLASANWLTKALALHPKCNSVSGRPYQAT